jgi:hypothetical protein
MLFRKLLVVALVLAFSATAASAFTVVMRSGRRVEIPNTFTLTKSSLTYETAPGIQVTIPLVSIDVDATERINGQPAGSFLATASQPKAPPAEPVRTQRTTPARSITNQDLETYRRARVENERQRQELGLPSVEDRRREVEEIDNRTQEQIREMRSREELEFWRNRAMSLETQMVTTQAQISNMQNQVNDFPWAYPYGVGLVTGGFPFAFDGFNRFDKFGFKHFGFNNFGFNRFGFNNNFGFNAPSPGFRGRLLFTTPRSVNRGGFRGGSVRGGGHGGGVRGGGGRGGRR